MNRGPSFLWLPVLAGLVKKKKEKENYRAAQEQKQEEKIEINTCVKKWSMCVIFIMNTVQSGALVVCFPSPRR